MSLALAAHGTPLTGVAGNANATSYTYPSATYTAGNLYLLVVLTANASTTNPTKPTVSGSALTWTETHDLLYDGTGTQQSRVTAFRCVASSATEAATIDYGGVTQDGCCAHCVEITGADTGGTNGGNAFVQWNDESVSTGVHTRTFTLDSAMGAAVNIHLAFLCKENTESVSQGDGETELYDASTITAPNRSISAQYKVNDTSSVFDWTTNAANGGISVEVKEAAGGTDATVTGVAAAATAAVSAPLPSVTVTAVASSTAAVSSPVAQVTVSPSAAAATASCAASNVLTLAPVVVTGVFGGGSGTNSSTYPIAAQTFLSGHLYVAFVLTENASGVTPTLPTLQGTALTWTEAHDNAYDSAGTQRSRLTAFYTVPVSTVTEAVTVDYGGVTQDGAILAIVQCYPTDTSGSPAGANAFVQFIDAAATSGVTTRTLTLGSALAQSVNANLAALGRETQEAGTPGGSETEIYDHPTTTNASPNRTLTVQYELNDTASVFNWTTATTNGGFAMEIAAGEPSTTVVAAVASATAGVSAPVPQVTVVATAAAATAAVSSPAGLISSVIVAPAAGGTAANDLDGNPVSVTVSQAFAYGSASAPAPTLNFSISPTVTPGAADATAAVSAAVPGLTLEVTFAQEQPPAFATAPTNDFQVIADIDATVEAVVAAASASCSTPRINPVVLVPLPNTQVLLLVPLPDDDMVLVPLPVQD